jgi:glutaredoxin 2
MVANYSNVDHKKAYLLNDDEDTCFRLIGSKMVPILEFANGTAMAESLDIVATFNELADAEHKLISGDNPSRVTTLLNSVSFAINCLLYPRNILIEQPEYATPSSIAYFTAKKEKIIDMSFAEAMARTAEFKSEVESALAALPELPLPSSHDNKLAWFDIYVFPTLRNLTMVKELEIPVQVSAYIAEVASLTRQQLYFTQSK